MSVRQACDNAPCTYAMMINRQQAEPDTRQHSPDIAPLFRCRLHILAILQHSHRGRRDGAEEARSDMTAATPHHVDAPQQHAASVESTDPLRHRKRTNGDNFSANGQRGAAGHMKKKGSEDKTLRLLKAGPTPHRGNS